MLKFRDRDTALKYLHLTAIWIFIFLFAWFFYVFWFIDSGIERKVDFDSKFFMRMFLSNYQGSNLITVLLPLPFAFSVDYLVGDYNPFIITRFKSRGSFSAISILKIFIFAVVFAVLHEVINLVCLSFFFNGDYFVQLNVFLYSFFNVISLSLYYFRIGAGLLLFQLIVKRKLAPFFLSAIYFFEGLVLLSFAESANLWLPLNDSTVIYELMENSIGTYDLILIFARGIVVDATLAIIAYFGFQKKDVLQSEKK